MAAQHKEIAYLTHLRAVSCIAIVILHTFYASSALTTNFWEKTAALTIRNLMMWAVPCFVMVTGTLLLDGTKTVTYKKLFQRYMPRVLAALLLCAVLFELLDTLAAGEAIRPSTFLTGLKNALTGQSWSHLWYLYLIIGLYLLMPFYRKAACSLNQKDACYLMIVLLLFLSLIPMIEALTDYHSAFYICVYTVYPLYLFLGYILSQQLLPFPRWLWIVFTVVGTCGELGLTIISEKTETSVLSFLLENYASPMICLQAAGIFGMLTSKKSSVPACLHRILRQIDRCSFGIYLLHMVFLKAAVVYFQWNPYAHGGTAAVLLLAAAVFICTFACVCLLQCIPRLLRRCRRRADNTPS